MSSSFRSSGSSRTELAHQPLQLTTSDEKLCRSTGHLLACGTLFLCRCADLHRRGGVTFGSLRDECQVLHGNLDRTDIFLSG